MVLGLAVEWPWRAPQAQGVVLNITHGDVVLWRSALDRLAVQFGLPLGEPAPQRLAESMPRHAGLWRRIAERESLRMADLGALIGLSWL